LGFESACISCFFKKFGRLKEFESAMMMLFFQKKEIAADRLVLTRSSYLLPHFSTQGLRNGEQTN